MNLGEGGRRRCGGEASRVAIKEVDDTGISLFAGGFEHERHHFFVVECVEHEVDGLTLVAKEEKRTGGLGIGCPEVGIEDGVIFRHGDGVIPSDLPIVGA